MENVIKMNQQSKENRGRPKKSAQLMELLEPYDLCKSKGIPYLINKGQALEIGSLQYKDFLSKLFYEYHAEGLTDNQIKEVIGIQRGRALFASDEQTIYIRTAAISETEIYIDLADKEQNIVRLIPGKWEIVKNTPVIFSRPKNIGALPLPAKTGNIDLLKKFMNLKDENDFKLLKASLAYILRGRPGERGSYMVLFFTGPEGCAKSTASKICKSIVDPGTPETRTQGNDVRNLYIAASNCHVLCLDNISHITGDLSDAMCSLVTGGGYACKLNYSDNEEMIFEVCISVFMNGISCKMRADLTSRLVTLEFNPIHATERKTETEIYDSLEKDKPEIFAGLLTILANSLNEYEKGFDTPPLPRLADFARFSIALERGNGWAEGEIIEALKESYDNALDGIVDENPILNVLYEVLQNGNFQGTAIELLELLNNNSDERLQKHKIWPTTAAALGVILKRQHNVLLRMGIIIERGEGRDRRKYNISLSGKEIKNENVQLDMYF